MIRESLNSVTRVTMTSPQMDRLLQDVTAFLNSDGGIICLNVRADSNIARTLYEREIRGGIRPDPGPYVRIEEDSAQGIRIEISPGPRTPYYTAKGGMSPDGVFVRRDNATSRVGALGICRMLRATYGEVHESMRSLAQDLTFEQAKQQFADAGIRLRPELYSRIGITNPVDGEYTNLGRILSDQCTHSVRLFRCAAGDRNVHTESYEVFGNVCAQYALATQRLLRLLHADMLRSRDGGTCYPHGVLREAMALSILARDYGTEGSMLVEVSDAGIWFTVAGGLRPIWTDGPFPAGSGLRNVGLSRVFRLLQYIDDVPAHASSILTKYRATHRRPTFDITRHTLSIFLPNLLAESATAPNPEEVYDPRIS